MGKERYKTKIQKKYLLLDDDQAIKVGMDFKCTNSFKVSMLPGGFTKGKHYKVIGFDGDEFLMSDDEGKDYDPFGLNPKTFYEYFSRTFEIITT